MSNVLVGTVGGFLINYDEVQGTVSVDLKCDKKNVNILTYFVTDVDNEGKILQGDTLALKEMGFGGTISESNMFLAKSSTFPQNLLNSSDFKNSIFNKLHLVLKDLFDMRICDFYN